MKKAVASALCPKIYRSESENFVIKVTINNRSGNSHELMLISLYRGIAYKSVQGETFTESEFSCELISNKLLRLLSLHFESEENSKF